MTTLSTRDIFALGFMTFALFIGAGNIIFPPIVAQQAGSHVWLAAAGFLMTAVGLPVLTIMALARVEGSLETMSAPIGRAASTALAIICYLSVGPLFATPRTATVSYEIGFSSIFGESAQHLFVYSAIYFVIVAIISLYPNKLLDSIGHVLAPIKIVALAILCATTLLLPIAISVAPVDHYIERPVSEGLVNGYLTMDTLGALVFGIVIVRAIYSRGVTDKKLVMRYAVIASLIAGIGLTSLYLCLFRLGSQSQALIPHASNGAVILHAYVEHTLGHVGALFLSTLIFLACLVTAIGLTCSCAEYFNGLTKIPYKYLVLILVGSAFVVSNLGLTKLIAFSVPVLTAIYPPAIVLIFLSFFGKLFNKPSRVVIPVTIIACLLGILSGLKASSLSASVTAFIAVTMPVLSHLPLADQNLDWLLPCLAVLMVSMLVDRSVKE